MIPPACIGDLVISYARLGNRTPLLQLRAMVEKLNQAEGVNPFVKETLYRMTKDQIASIDRTLEGFMTPIEKRNENIKLAANWCNTIATAIMTAGAFLPSFQLWFGTMPPGTNQNTIVVSATICVVASLFIHLVGQYALRKLQ